MLVINYTGKDGNSYTIEIAAEDFGSQLIWQGYALVEAIGVRSDE